MQSGLTQRTGTVGQVVSRWGDELCTGWMIHPEMDAGLGDAGLFGHRRKSAGALGTRQGSPEKSINVHFDFERNKGPFRIQDWGILDAGLISR